MTPPSLLEQSHLIYSDKKHREEGICEAKGEIRGVVKIAKEAKPRSNLCYYRIRIADKQHREEGICEAQPI